MKGKNQKLKLFTLNRILEEHTGEAVAVGSHGTALSTLIRNFDPTYGFDDFKAIQKLRLGKPGIDVQLGGGKIGDLDNVGHNDLPTRFMPIW